MRATTTRVARLALAVALCAGCESALQPSPAPSPAATRDGRFVQDIEALARDLPRLHANLFFQISRDAFEREVETLKTRVAELRDHEVIAGLVRIAALPGDGHTSVSPFGSTGFRRLPLRLRFLSDGLVVTAAGPGAEALLGGRVLSLGDLDQAAAVERITPLVSHDNDAGLRALAPNYLIVPELLHAQHIAPELDRVRVAVLAPDGSRAQIELPAMTAGQEGPLRDATEAAGATVPLYRQRSQENYWSTWIEPDVAYIRYSRCQNMGFDPMTSFARRVFDEIDRRTPRAVVVDLRDNGGGDSSVADPLIQGLRSRRHLADSGRLFTLIGNGTFSSALMNAITLRREAGAILVGEPTGGKPNAYGQVRSFALPNSGLTVSYSTQFFRLLPDSNPDSLYPDVAAAVSSADYRAGRDPALAAIAARLGLTLQNAR